MSPAIGRHDVEQFRALVADRLGLCFDDSKLGVLADALRRRVEAGNGAGDDYLIRLAASHCPPEELRALAQDLTVTETYFYRSVDQIHAFVERVLPRCLAASAGSRRARVLSAGCASGDEPYSLAIAIRERLPEAADRVAITAVDVNPAMLDKAHQARYSAWSLREFPVELRPRWFRAEGPSFLLDDAVRRAVTFEERNLAHGDPELWQAQSWDVVFCRNLLMYFSPSLAQAVVERIARSLVPGGYLFLGHAETLRGLSNDFHLCHTHDTFYYQLREGAPGRATDFVASTRERIDGVGASPLSADSTWVDTVRRTAERIDALAELSNALSAAPPATERVRDPQALLLRAVSLVHSGALAPAEPVCRELIECDELNAGAHYLLALCREGSGDPAGAVEEDRIAVYLDPGFAMARLHLGLLARRRGERETARRELSEALLRLRREDVSRLLLFGGGFSREALITLCRSELGKCGERT